MYIREPWMRCSLVPIAFFHVPCCRVSRREVHLGERWCLKRVATRREETDEARSLTR